MCVTLCKNMFASPTLNTLHYLPQYTHLSSSVLIFFLRKLDSLSHCSLLFRDECKFYNSQPLLGCGNGLRKLLCTPHWLSEREEGKSGEGGNKEGGRGQSRWRRDERRAERRERQSNSETERKDSGWSLAPPDLFSRPSNPRAGRGGLLIRMAFCTLWRYNHRVSSIYEGRRPVSVLSGFDPVF